MDKVDDIEVVKKKKSFKQKKITEFLNEYGDSDLKFNDEKIKLCSSDDFNDIGHAFVNIQKKKHAPIMISQVGGFYVMASLAGYAASKSRTKPTLLFFDRKNNNIANAIYNTLLMQAIRSKERYITTLLGLDDKDIIRSLNKKKYDDYIVQVFVSENDISDIQSERIPIHAMREYNKDTKRYDEIIASKHILPHRAMRDLEESFDIGKIEDYLKDKPYNPAKHFDIIMSAVAGKLSKEQMSLFAPLASSMTDYLAKDNHYQSLVKYLTKDVKKNSYCHILNNDSLYSGYRSLINQRGQSAVHFVPGVDISTDTGLNKLEGILANEGLLNRDENSNTFPIDIAFLPHIESLQEAYPFIKRNVEQFIKVNRGTNDNFTMHPTAGLHVRTYESIGATFIEEERKNRKPLKHLTPLEESKKGFPLITFIGNSPYGNIYNSEKDLNNVIDMIIADKVDKVYINGLIYATYYHNQTDRRMLIDPKYQTLDQRLKAAKKLIKKLNDNGIKVVYQMGAEEYHLYEDMFSIYTKEQGVTGKNFLAREDKKSAFDWVRPIIIQELIPYMIRSGEDLTNFYTDEEQETRVTELCNALKNYREGLPLGELAKYIKPEFLQDTEMFRVVYSTKDSYINKDNEKNSEVSLNLISNPNYSFNTQYANPIAGLMKSLSVEKDDSQLVVDGSQGAMYFGLEGSKAVLSVPPMVEDDRHSNKSLLPGIKEHITSDPTHARVTKISTRPNHPGSWTITGDPREKMTVVPYFKRVREVMEYVNKTGKGLEPIDALHFNDFQIGSLSERLLYDLKMIDYFLYCYKHPKGMWGNGDFQHGWNYKSFANESRHLGTMSIAQQWTDFMKLIDPWMREVFGVINPLIFVGKYDKFQINKETSLEIMNHLSNIKVIKSNMGLDNNYYLIKNGVDYNTINLKLPPHLKPYESVIRLKLADIKLLKFIHLSEGNHEYNSDWDKKGTNLIKLLHRELYTMNETRGSNVEIAYSEFIVNNRGDIVQAPHGCKTINGYNIAYAHLFNQAKGDYPTRGMSQYFNRMRNLIGDVHIVFMSHLHVIKSQIIDDVLYSITGSGAGQSGFEQQYGYSSQPYYVVDRFLPDGRFAFDIIGIELLKDYKIQNPYVNKIGVDKFIDMCISEEARIYGFDGVPKEIQEVRQRKLVLAKPNEVIGPKID